MRNSFSAFLLVTGTLLLSVLACHSQGLVEQGAVNGGASGLAGSMNRKANVDNLSKIFGRASALPVNKGNTTGLSNIGSTTGIRRRNFSSEEVKQATEQSNKFYNLAVKSEKAGKFDEAKLFYYKAAITRTHIWGDSDPSVAAIILKIGDIEIKQKHPDEARIWFKRGLTALSKHYGSGDYELVPALSQLAKLEANEKKHEAASSYYEHILRLQERKFGEENAACVPTRISLIREYLGANDAAEADKIAQKAIAIETKTRGVASEDYSKLQQFSTQIATVRASNSSK